MLKNEEIKMICEKHRLQRKEVYDIRSQFVSMCMLAKENQINAANDKEAALMGGGGSVFGHSSALTSGTGFRVKKQD